MSKRCLSSSRAVGQLAALLALTATFGCDDGGADPQPIDDAGAETRDGGRDAAQPQGDAAQSNQGDAAANAQQDGGVAPGSDAGDAALPGPDGEVTPEQLIAAKTGRVWTYAVTPDPSSAACTSASITRTVNQILEEQGTRHISFMGQCGEGHEIRFVGQNVEQWYPGDVWHLALAAPVREGATFMSLPPYQFEWRFAGNVTVRAGTFSNCWTRKTIDMASETTYCPGIGKVRSTTEKRFSLELTAVTP